MFSVSICWRRSAPSSRFRAVYQLGSAIVGGPQAVIAVLLTMTVTAFSTPGIEFGPVVPGASALGDVPAACLQLALRNEGRRNAWFALSIEAGLLLLTTPLPCGCCRCRSSSVSRPHDRRKRRSCCAHSHRQC